MPRFGPPRACSARFGLARGRSPGFGSLRGDYKRPFGLAFAPAPPVPGLASPPRTTRRLILQKARRHPTVTSGSDRPGAHGFRSVSLPSPGCFSPFPHGTGSLSVAGGIQPWAVVGPASRRVLRARRYSRNGSTPRRRIIPTGLSPAPAARSSGLRNSVVAKAKALPSPQTRPSNPGTASPAGCAAAPVWAPPRSLAATKGILSFPRGTEMFQFPRCPPALRG